MTTNHHCHPHPAAAHVRLGLGALYAFDLVPGALRASCRGNPQGAMAFIRVKVD